MSQVVTFTLRGYSDIDKLTSSTSPPSFFSRCLRSGFFIERCLTAMAN